MTSGRAAWWKALWPVKQWSTLTRKIQLPTLFACSRTLSCFQHMVSHCSKVVEVVQNCTELFNVFHNVKRFVCHISLA